MLRPLSTKWRPTKAMAKDGSRPMRSGPKPPLAGAALRQAVMAIWCICFCGMQWGAIGLLWDIPFGTLYGLLARWTRVGLWRRLLAVRAAQILLGHTKLESTARYLGVETEDALALSEATEV
jgi:hypothetical protein